MFSWGCNQNAQLGHGDNEKRILPQELTGFGGRLIKDLVCGSRFTVAVSVAGNVYTWGKGADGQLGLGGHSSSSFPTLVPSIEGENIISISTRGSHVLAAALEGQVFAWGRNDEAQLGLGHANEVVRPTIIPRFSTTGVKIIKVSCGRSHSLFLSNDYKLWSSGSGEEGATGLGHSLPAIQPELIKFPDESLAITDISCGSRHSIAVAGADRRRIYSWGWNAYGQLGLGDKSNRNVPCQLNTPESVPILIASCGYRHTLLIVSQIGASEESGEPECRLLSWGWNHSGQCGLPASEPILLPTPVTAIPEDHSVENVVGGGRHTLLLLSRNLDGAFRLFAFGRNDDGQLGIFTDDPSNTLYSVVDLPRRVALTGENVRIIAAGWAHSLCATERAVVDANILERAQSTYKLVSERSEPEQDGYFPNWLRFLKPSGNVSIFSLGNIDAAFAQTMNTIILFLLMVQLLPSKAGFSADFVTRHVVVGAAFTVFIGNVSFAFLATKLSIKSRSNRRLTATPHGINTVLVFGYIVLIAAPVYMKTGDFQMAYNTTLFCCFLLGALEIPCILVVKYLKKYIPKAAMTAAMSGIGLTFISMTFFVQAFQEPITGIIPLFLVLIAYGANISLPFKLPAALGGVLLGTFLFYSVSNLFPMAFELKLSSAFDDSSERFLSVSFHLEEILAGMMDPGSYPYITSVVLPMLIINVVTNLSCIESAASVGDDYKVESVLLLDAIVTMIGATLGNPFPTAIYIGHPAFKAMGADIGYNYLNAVFVLLIGVLNGAVLIDRFIPEVSAFGLLVWIGLCVTTDGFKVDQNHHVAVALGILPSIAAFVVQQISSVVATYEESSSEQTNFPELVSRLQAKNIDLLGLTALSKGYLLSSIFLSSTFVNIVERDFLKAAVWMMIGSFLSFIGVVHAFEITDFGTKSNFGFPAEGDNDPRQMPLQYSGAYLIIALILVGFSLRESDFTLSDFLRYILPFLPKAQIVHRRRKSTIFENMSFEVENESTRLISKA